MASTNTSIACCALAFAFIAGLFLSVDAISCHQCNSHVDDDCIALGMNTTKSPRDDRYLRKCEGGQSPDSVAYCRKSDIVIALTREHRVIRGCSWHSGDHSGERKTTCYESDNEGFVQVTCICFTDGCNAAPRLGGFGGLGLGVVALIVLLTTAFRRSG